MATIKYLGCFFQKQQLYEKIADLDRTPLHRAIPYPHMTCVYRPEEIPEALFGTPVTVRVTGYGCDGENEALRVQFEELPKALRALAENIPVPHITLSVSEFGKSVNSGRLAFEPVEPFLLKGIFGGFDEETGAPVLD